MGQPRSCSPWCLSSTLYHWATKTPQSDGQNLQCGMNQSLQVTWSEYCALICQDRSRDLNTGLWLVQASPGQPRSWPRAAPVLASDWTAQVTWSEYCALIWQDRSRDLNTGLCSHTHNYDFNSWICAFQHTPPIDLSRGLTNQSWFNVYSSDCSSASFPYIKIVLWIGIFIVAVDLKFSSEPSWTGDTEQVISLLFSFTELIFPIL